MNTENKRERRPEKQKAGVASCEAPCEGVEDIRPRAEVAPLSETHRFFAPGVWLPKETTPACAATYGEWGCACARGHRGLCRNVNGEPLGRNA